MRLPVVSCALLSLLPMVRAQSRVCAATPEAAALSVLSRVDVLREQGAGYRVVDIQADSLTHRVWVRVRPCNNDAAPAMLIPVQADLGASLRASQTNAQTSTVQAAPLLAVIHAGDIVRVVWRTASVHLEVEGKALQYAAIGQQLEVTLRRNEDEPEHRIRGTLRADHSVEVQP
jgi:hypothetical protein